MAGVAHSGSTVEQTVRNGYVTYEIWSWQPPWCAAVDPISGVCIDPRPGYWYQSGNGSTNARITVNPIQSTSSVYVNGNPIATEGSQTILSWVADPPVPSNTSSTEYRNIQPAFSGAGTATVVNGNSRNIYANGKSVAQIGSQVETSLDTNTTITSGSSNVFIG